MHFSLFIGSLVHVYLKAPSNAFSLQICNNVLIHLIGYRKWAHTMANVTSNFWWFVVTYSFKDFYIYAGPHVPFLVYGVVCLLGFIFIYVFLPETQGIPMLMNFDDAILLYSGQMKRIRLENE